MDSDKRTSGYYVEVHLQSSEEGILSQQYLLIRVSRV